MKVLFNRSSVPAGFTTTHGKGSPVTTPVCDIIDCKGNVLKVGDDVAAAVTVYRSANLRVVKIKEILEIPVNLYDYMNHKEYPTDMVIYHLKFENCKFTRPSDEVVKVA